MPYIAPYITRGEYECPCCKRIPPDLERVAYEVLFSGFKMAREEWRRPLPISSGFRCPKRNKAVGGGDLSVHLFGLALDIDVSSGPEAVLLATIFEETNPDFRRGTYTQAGTFVHVDVGYYISPRIVDDWQPGVRWNK